MTRLRVLVAAVAATACVAGAVWATQQQVGVGPDTMDEPWLPRDEIALPTAVTPGEELADRLGGVDHVPTKAELDELLGSEASSSLIALARADASEVDAGVRLRAYRALAYYPGPLTELALTQAISEHAEVASGMDVPYLRAAVHSYAAVAGQNGVDILAAVLVHPSKDARASAADALAMTGAREALEVLHARLEVESDPQVIRSIMDAIRILNEDQ